MKNESLQRKRKLKKLKSVLVIIDMVKGFVTEGKMHDPYIDHITEEIVRLTQLFLSDEEKEIIAFKDAHELGCAEFNRFPEHCIKGTRESELVDELIPYEKFMTVFEKNSTSGFVVEGFRNYLLKNQEKIKKFVLVGCCTDICVANFAIPLKNYIDENNLDIEVVVPTNAVETYGADYHDRDKYNEMGFNIMTQGGISLIKKYGGEKYGK